MLNSGSFLVRPAPWSVDLLHRVGAAAARVMSGDAQLQRDMPIHCLPLPSGLRGCAEQVGGGVGKGWQGKIQPV